MINTSGFEGVDDLLGSVTNPIVIDGDDTCDMQNTTEEHNSDADTVIMGSPEFWGCLNEFHCPGLTGERAVERSSNGPGTSEMRKAETAELVEDEKSTLVIPVYKGDISLWG